MRVLNLLLWMCIVPTMTMSLASQSGAAQNLPPLARIGTVIQARGDVSARDRNGQLRPLARRAAIFTGDTVLTGATTSAQLKMLDDARISLQSNTSLTFDHYEFNDTSPGKQLVLMSITRGCLRTITALANTLATISSTEYSLDTPFASIHLNDTHATYSIGMVNDALYAAASVGQIRVSNNRGTLLLGSGGDFDYGTAPSKLAPAGLLDAWQSPCNPAEGSALKPGINSASEVNGTSGNSAPGTEGSTPLIGNDPMYEVLELE